MNLLRSVSFLALATAAAASQAALTVYTDRASFLAALGTPTTTETFDTDLVLQLGDNLYNGVNYRQTGAVSFGFIEGGQLSNDQEDGFNGAEIVFGSAVRGFGADFFRANNSSGLAFTIDGETASLADALGSPGTGFFGIVSDADFTTVVFSNANPAPDRNEGYSYDNLTYGPTSSAPAVPGPLAALPFALIALNRRRRRA